MVDQIEKKSVKNINKQKQFYNQIDHHIAELWWNQNKSLMNS